MHEWASRLRAGSLLLAICLFPIQSGAQATDNTTAIFETGGEELPLYLEVFINGETTELIGEFALRPDGTMSVTAGEMRELGIVVPPGAGRNSTVILEELPEITYNFDTLAQTIDFLIPIHRLRPVVTSAAYKYELSPETDTSFGLALNYDVFGQYQVAGPGAEGLQQVSLSADARLFSKFGTLSHSAYILDSRLGNSSYTRLSTTFESNFPGKAVSLRIGDTISSAPSWGRPIRMGGIQIKRDFSLRSDIITEPLLSFGGVANAPTTVDVFIENNRVYSGSTGVGPYVFEDIPTINGSGDAVIYVQDINGQTVRKEVSFFQSSYLLKKGVFDYSLEIGKARVLYGRPDSHYGDRLLYSGSMRYGLTDRITTEAHFEGADNLKLFGLGAAFVIANRAEVSFSASTSQYKNQTGQLFYGAFRTFFGNNKIEASTLRADSDFADLSLLASEDYHASIGSLLTDNDYPASRDIISASFPLRRKRASLGVSYLRSKRGSVRDEIASVSYTQGMKWNNGTLSLSASRDFEDKTSRVGLFVSIPIGKKRTSQFGTEVGHNGKVSQSIYVAQALGQAIGDTGFDAQLKYQQDRLDIRGSVKKRTRVGRAEMEVQKVGDTALVSGRFAGSLIWSGGTIVAGNQVRDAFAVVKVGVPGASVYLDNREAARANRFGNAVVSGLSSYRPNRVALNVEELPLDVVPETTAAEVAPGRNSGVVVDFGTSNTANNALVSFVDPRGKPLEMGAIAHLRGETFIVGYDGEAYIEGLSATNSVRIDTGNGVCNASFRLANSNEIFSQIGPVVCQ